LTISPAGSRSWSVLLYDEAGKGKLYGLKTDAGRQARYPAVKSAEARRLALAIRTRSIADLRGLKFGGLWGKFLSERSSLNSFQNLSQCGKKDFLPHWHDLPISAIKPDMIIGVLQLIVDRGTLRAALRDPRASQAGSRAANAALTSLRTFFNWCIAQGVLFHSPCDGVPWPAPDLVKRDKESQRNKRRDMEAAYRFVKAQGLL
jgi:hypothetical protein